jgi:hypothetical protein
MDRRKRRALEPHLESMEDRVVLSVTSVSLQHLHHQRAVAAHVAKVSVAKEPKANANNEALRNLNQQLKVVHEHALERTPSAIPTAAEQRATQISNIFKSLESAL